MVATEARTYIEERDGGLWIAGTRMSLASVVVAYNEGESPEQIRDSYPALSLEEIHGAIAFYLAHRAEVDAYLEQRRQRYEAERQRLWEQDPALHERLITFRDHMLEPKRTAS